MANPSAALPGVRSIALPREPRRGLLGHMMAVLVQPVAFFRAMPSTRQWLGAALIVLLLIGFAEVRRTALNAPADDSGVVTIPGDFSTGIPDVSSVSGVPGPGASDVPFTPPVPVDVGAEGSSPSITDTTVTLLVAASGVILTWLLQALILLPVPMFNGRAPDFSRNLQVAVWASVPLAVMALVQVVYYAFGGRPGAMGLTVLLERFEAFATLPVVVQAALHSLASHFTLFWLWSLILLFIGARQALRGRVWAVAMLWVIWVLVAILLPVLSGAVKPLNAGTATGDMEMTAPPAEMLPDMLGPQDSSWGGVPVRIEPAGGEIQIVPGGTAP